MKHHKDRISLIVAFTNGRQMRINLFLSQNTEPATKTPHETRINPDQTPSYLGFSLVTTATSMSVAFKSAPSTVCKPTRAVYKTKISKLCYCKTKCLRPYLHHLFEIHLFVGFDSLFQKIVGLLILQSSTTRLETQLHHTVMSLHHPKIYIAYIMASRVASIQLYP